MSKSCVICGTSDSEGELLLAAPCGRHHVCSDCIPTFFENATNSESLFPPKCCGQIFMLEEYEDYVPFEVSWGYQVKQAGEYSVLAKCRIYCANPPCATFLHPSTHITDPATNLTYAPCTAPTCSALTCTKCRALLTNGATTHACAQTEDEAKFKQTATEKGYQECFVCGATVELAEACNHITCECGSSFCYICGIAWPGLHACPQYGPAVYDEEGYNQDGYHRDTGLNRDGLTRRQEAARQREQGVPDEEEDDEEEGEGDDPEWEVLQHLTLEQREMVNGLPRGMREDALDQFRIELFEERGITFDQGFGAAPPPPTPQQQDDEAEAEGENPDNDEDEEAVTLENNDHDQDESEDNDAQNATEANSPTTIYQPTATTTVQTLNEIYNQASVLLPFLTFPPTTETDRLHLTAFDDLMHEAATLLEPHYDPSFTNKEREVLARMLELRRQALDAGEDEDSVWGRDKNSLRAEAVADIDARHSEGEKSTLSSDTKDGSGSPGLSGRAEGGVPLAFRGPSGAPGAWVDEDL